jgi:hypothetical protein
MRGVSIGGYQSLRLVGGSISTMLPALSGEIWVEHGLDEALQFDRESFREDHPSFQDFKRQIEREVEKESKGFRQRSQIRKQDEKRNGSKGKQKLDEAQATTSQQAIPSPSTPTGVADAFIDPGIFRDCPHFISYLVPQINGCWDRAWLEACALIIRRLLETLIIWLFDQRGWSVENRDTDGSYFKLQTLVDKVCGDSRIRLTSREASGLQHLKAIGDEAAHDFKVRVRRNDLKSHRLELRLACERLIFIARNQGGGSNL